MDLRPQVTTPDARASVAILAGGEGTRLRARSGPMPKSLVPLGGAPLLEHQLELCRRHGFVDILLLVHYEHAALHACFGDGSRHGVALRYQIERTPRGTAGAVRDALPRLADTFLLIYGDTYLDVDLRRMWNVHRARACEATLFVHPNDHPHDSDLVELDADDFVTALHSYPHEGRPARNLVNAALYVLERNSLDTVIPADGRIDFARETFPRMLHGGARLYGYRSPEYIKDMGTPDRLDQVAADVAGGVPARLSARQRRRAVFLDRDGTLNVEVEYLTRPEDLALTECAASAVRRLNRTGYLAVVVTNQSVVARGDLTLAGLERVHAQLEYLLGRDRAYLDRIYACPHHPDGGFPGEVTELKVVCDCRKPATGMIDTACLEMGIGREDSWLVGDTTSDIETGRRAGLRTVLVRTGHAGQDGRFPMDPDYVVADLAEAVAWILDGHPVILDRVAEVVAAAAGARLIAIGGLARTGKSSVAQVVREAVLASGRPAHVISLDSWLKPLAQRADAAGVAARYDVETARLVVTALARRSAPLTLEVPVYDRINRAMYARRRTLSIGPDDLVIVEGVPALLDDGPAGLADVRVHVEMPEAERVARVRADYRWRGMPDADIDALLASREADETGAVQEARARANFIVSAWTPA